MCEQKDPSDFCYAQRKSTLQPTPQRGHAVYLSTPPNRKVMVPKMQPEKTNDQTITTTRRLGSGFNV